MPSRQQKRRAYLKRYSDKNAVKKAEYNKQHYEHYKEIIKAASRAVYHAAPKKKQAASRVVYKANSEKKRAISRALYRAEPEKKKASSRALYRVVPDKKRLLLEHYIGQSLI